jgi:hypothetical protein
MTTIAALADRFEELGRELAAKGLFVEIAAGAGAATLLLFEWATVDGLTELIVREIPFEEIVAPTSAQVAMRSGVEENWLDGAVGLTGSPADPDALFEASGTYPRSSRPGLRILVASEGYVDAMRRLSSGRSAA